VTAYVDDMRAPLGRLILCHMLADTEAELHAMADRIGVARRWFQGDHYDVARGKRAQAIAAGARPVTSRELAAMRTRRRVEGALGEPETALDWFKARAERRSRELLDREPAAQESTA
jgi:hypothetical protein